MAKSLRYKGRLRGGEEEKREAWDMRGLEVCDVRVRGEGAVV